MIPRLYIEDDLEGKTSLHLSADHTHYLKNVLRRKGGDIVRLFNGRHGEHMGEISVLSRKVGEVALIKKVRNQVNEPDFWVLFPLLKKAATDFLIEKCTELGAAAFYPVTTARTNANHVNIGRLQRHAMEAAEQTERLTLPTIHPPQSLEKILANWLENRWLVMGDESHASAPVQKVLAGQTKEKAAILVGPEGGFTTEEHQMLKAKSYVAGVDLGPRVLRADTAAISLMTALQIFQGDWGA